MIHRLLQLTRPLFVLDTETTGINPQSDRIVEIGFEMWTSEGLQKEWRSFVDPGMVIPSGAIAVHGIDNERMKRCNKCGRDREEHPLSRGPLDMSTECLRFHPVPRFFQLAENLAKGLRDCDFAGKRVRFDLQIMQAEMTRADVKWSYIGARIVDADRLEQIAEPRHLSALHKKYVGHEHDNAHGAMSDVRASTTVIVKQLERYEALPRDLDTLHKLQWPGFVDVEGRFRFIDGVPCFGPWGKYANKPMRSVDVGYWDFILKNDFPSEIKTLAANAKLGKFPEER